MTVLPNSAETWRDAPPAPLTPPELIVEERRPWHRLRGSGRRLRTRMDMARRTWNESLAPERGLPVAPIARVGAFMRDLVGTERGWLALVLGTNVLGAIAGLVAPAVLGRLVDDITAGRATHESLLTTVLVVAVAVVVHALMMFGARASSAAFGQSVLAAARERLVRGVLRLPLGVVESSSSGDLITRVTRNVGSMSRAVQWGLPELLIAAFTVVFTMVALLWNSVLLAVPSLLAMVLLGAAAWWYLRRTAMAYTHMNHCYGQVNSVIAETTENARTVEALRLGRERRDRFMEQAETGAQAERLTIGLDVRLFLSSDIVFNGPLLLLLLLAVVGLPQGWFTLGALTTAILYVQALGGPMDRVVHALDNLQMGVAGATRVLGVEEVPPDRTVGEERPADDVVRGEDLRFAYREGHDVLHGITLDLKPGERLAIVGPSGSGKSTLGRLLSGINGPREGRATVGGVDLVSLPLDLLRTEVALVTQEHHVFVGTIRDNIVLARDTQLSGEAAGAAVEEALRAVDAWGWVSALPKGVETRVGTGNHQLTPAQAQQVALARLVVANPHTLVLDEATSLIDPGTARHLEGSMAALMDDRTVVAIAHRLHTAHDADRIAVLIDGRITEMGSHDELIAAGGEYARLWDTWTS